MGDEHSRLTRWQRFTVALLFVGYTGYYLCRSNLSVTQTSIEEELATRGMSLAAAHEALGAMISFGTLAYAAGKFLCGGVADALGGRRNVLVGMAGAVACTLVFALGGSLPVFTAAWVGNRFIQSIGWIGIVKITSRWFPFTTYGTVMGVLSCSFLFGDAADRLFMGALISAGLGWRGVFVVAACVLLGLFLVSLVVLKESPRQLGLTEPRADPLNVYGAVAVETEPTSAGAWERLGPLLRSRTFGVVCLLSAGLTFLRETFNTWTPTYFTRDVGLSKGASASYSSLFPLLGGVSVLIAGLLSDRLGRVGRAVIICGGLFLAGGALAMLGQADFAGSIAWPVGMVALVGFLLIGPYSFLAGAIALDLGGKRGSAAASGFIDGVGYIGGYFAGKTMAQVSTRYGWHGAFTVLAVVAWLSCLVAGLFLVGQWRAVRIGDTTTA